MTPVTKKKARARVAAPVLLPRAGHFIGARDCLFRLCHSVAGGRYLVSTVGEYQPKGWGSTTDFNEIGAGRKFETFVFRARPCPESECVPGCVQLKSGHEIDALGANDAATAYANHFALVKKWNAKGAR